MQRRRTHAPVTLWLSMVAMGCAWFGHAHALELNQASEAELDSLRGMGPALNRVLRQAREQQPFTSWADFQTRVAGVGAAKARAFSEQGLTVNGQPYRR